MNVLRDNGSFYKINAASIDVGGRRGVVVMSEARPRLGYHIDAPDWNILCGAYQ